MHPRESTDTQNRTHRVYTQLDELIQHKWAAKGLSLNFNARLLERVAGNHLSRFRGPGMAFREHLRYQDGDDPRHIDWHLTARKGEAYSKHFQEEVERPVLLVVDQRSSLFFGSQRRFKSVQAAETAALLAWMALQEKERVGALIVANTGFKSFRPSRRQDKLLHFLNALNETNQALQRPTDLGSRIQLADAMKQLSSLAGPGSRTVILSDWQDLGDDALDSLKICQRRSQVLAIQVYDPLERQLPREQLSVSDGWNSGTLDLRPQNRWHSVNQQLNERLQAIPKRLGLLGIPCLPLSTQDNPVTTLRALSQPRRGR